jgi:uncharacterized protein
LYWYTLCTAVLDYWGKYHIDRAFDSTIEGDYNNAMVAAIYNGDITVLQQLLIMGADPKRPNDLCGSALHAAARIGNSEAAILLLAKNAPTNNRDRNGFTPLLLAVFENYSNFVDVLHVNLGAVNGATPLSIAASRGYDTIARKLLSRQDIDVNSRDDIGNTPLTEAARAQKTAIASLLLKRGAQVNIRNQMGMTPLFYAAEDITELLLDHGATL